jgi:urease subunit alpha
MSRLSRSRYAELYGPTAGDLVRLGDTSLLAEVERDHGVPGEELMGKVGGTVRAGEGVRSRSAHSSGALDLVVTNVVVLDPMIGIVKGDLGIRNGRIVGVGKAGNPDVQRGVHEELVVGPHTSVLPGEGLIATPGAVEAHAHLLSPDQLDHALAAGVTTIVAMEWGNLLDIAVSGPTAIATLARALEQHAVNVGFLARGSAHDPDAIAEGVSYGCLGVKVHEDLGASPAAIAAALTAADRGDFSVCVHTDSMNESGYYEDTVAALGGRSVHMFHTEGAGGGHVPDIIRVNGLANVIPSSTNPTNPFTLGGLEESLPMTMLVHGLRPTIREDVLFAESRGRATTMAAEDLLHDMGAISIFAADSQGMGRIAENVACCWRLASVMKDRVGRLEQERTARADNERILRYLAKYTINPAIAYGLEDHVGSLEPGKLADVVIWSPATFGIRPAMVLKSGVPVWSTMGDPSASCTQAEPTMMRRQFGSVGAVPATVGILFVSALAIERGFVGSLGLRRRIEPIRSVRSLTKHHMVRNDALPAIEVDPLTFEVTADGQPLTCEPARTVPLSWRYLLR